MKSRLANMQKNQRRGITLLFVISLIVLFLLMGTSFVLLAGQYRKSAVATSRVNTRIDSSRSLIGRAFEDLVREPDLNVTSSPLRGQSILGDLYGYGVKSRVYLARHIDDRPSFQDTVGQMIRLRLDDDLDPTNNITTGPVPFPPVPMPDGDTFVRILDGQKEYFSNNAGEYEGQVLSFIDGPLAGTSVRILAYPVTPIPGAVLPDNRFDRDFVIMLPKTFTSMAFAGPPVPNSVTERTIADIEGSTVIINRREYSGTGAGLFHGNDRDIDPALAFSIPLNQPSLMSPNTLAPPGVPPTPYHVMMNNVYGPDEPPGSTRLNLRSLSPSYQANRAGESVDEFRLRYISHLVAGRPSFYNPLSPAPFAPVLMPNSVATNEDYDAADEQNWFLSYVRPFTGQEAYGPKVIPSFYRPQLTRYVTLMDNASQYPPPPAPPPALGVQATSANLIVDKDGRPRRDVFLADIRNPDGSPYYTDQIDHHSFYYPDPLGPGGLAQYPFLGRGDGVPDIGWDVDNDNDGIPDSIWMNIGLPIQTDASGRRFQPLVAYMVQDMDSRLNINAHGNPTQAQINPTRFKTSQLFLGGVNGVSEGQGYGPPEVSFVNAFANPAEVFNLLIGATVGGVAVPGRYGIAEQAPGIAGRDPASEYKLFNYPNANFFPNRGLLGNGFSSAMDIHGRVSWGVPNIFYANGPLLVDPYDSTNVLTANVPWGMPVIDMVTSGLATETINSAYEMDFSNAPFSASLSGVDTPYSPREMESLLRRYDFDTGMLPNRLRLLLQDSLNTSGLEIEKMLTSDSMEIPVPPESLNDRLHKALSEYGFARFGAWPEPQVPAPPTDPQPWTQDQAQSANLHIQWMLAPEVIQGRKMDLNFPLGNGRDDALPPGFPANGVVDEPSESANNPAELRPDPYGRIIPMDYNHNGDAIGSPAGTGDAGHLLIRQDFARRLYVLILLTTQYVDRNGDGDINLADWFDYDNSGGAPTVADLYEYRRDVAQWVANIVEFRDPDSICSAFEFDLNPWDGWDVDGDINTDETVQGTMGFLNSPFFPPPYPPIAAAIDRFVVWGTERPEMLLTESFVAHDRRDTDEAVESPSGGGRHTANGGMDDDLDSRLVPNASCFIELYNPWYRGPNAAAVANTAILPAEVYGNIGIDLRRMDLATGDSPVWRIDVLGYDEPSAQVRPIRTVYFQRPRNPALQTNTFPRNRVFFPAPNVRFGQLQPGQYAVLGSSGIQAAGSNTTYLGRRNTPTWDTELANTRSISLNTPASTVSVRWWDDPNSRWQTVVRNNVIAIPIGRQEDGSANGKIRSLGVTDPAVGYDVFAASLNPDYTTRAVPDGSEFYDSGLNVPVTLDEPIDRQANLAEWDELPQIFFDEATGLFTSMPANTTNQGLYQDQLRTNARAVVLMRLANPLIAWNPDPSDPEEGAKYDNTLPINPYLPVDYIGADVAVFNGVTNLAEDGMATPAPMTRSLTTMERATNFANQRNLWHADENGRITQLPYAAFANTDEHFVSQNMRDSLGEPDLDNRANGLVNAYSWLTWNNRPFVNHLELANVPRGANGQMLRQFSLLEVPAGVGESWYNGIDADKTSRKDLFRGRFGHLPDFLADAYSVDPAAVPDPEMAPLQNFLNYVEVPSRFVGTEFDLNPEVFSPSFNGVAPHGFGKDSGYLLFRYNPPYNTISRFRYPGKINLNTVSRVGVWNGVMGDYATPGGFVALADSRRDQGTTPVTFLPAFPPTPPVVPISQQADVPSDFPYIFRSSQKGNHVPEIYLAGAFANDTVTPGVYSSLNTRQMNPNALVQRSAQPSLFRAPNPATPDAPIEPMFDYLTNPGPHADPARNAYFRHDMRQRLGNTVTDKSSVFSIWITVGFFELNDNGTISSIEGSPRQRGFYMIDRSIPVAFEPGKNHNLERLILTSSIIE